jgi:hypothetical protein
MTKRKVEAPERPEDCHSTAQKVAYSMRLREIYEEQVCGPNSPPSALSDFLDRYPYNPAMPWRHPAWAEEWARRERARREIMRMVPDDE